MPGFASLTSEPAPLMLVAVQNVYISPGKNTSPTLVRKHVAAAKVPAK